jgi:hypothetical protein
VRLPRIGRFKNWDQANSWAIRVEWQYPENSGKWRFLYVQSGLTFELADARVPGSLKNYAKGVSFLQWITGSESNHHYPWIPMINGKARVMQLKKDMVNQICILHSNADPIRMLPGDILSNNAIKSLMESPEYSLMRVGGVFGDFGSAVVGHRKHCDTCFLASRYLMLGSSLDKTCVKDKHNNICCTNCGHFGRPCCSWTPGIHSMDRQNEFSPDQRVIVHRLLSALVRMPVAKIPEELQGFTQQFRALEESNKEDYGDYLEASEDELEGDDEETDDEEEEDEEDDDDDDE